MLDSKFEIYSLPQLQDRIKRDPSAYLSEFDLQLQHFYSTLDVFKLNPQNIPKEILQLMIFIAQTSPYYSKYGVCNQFIDKLVDELKNNSSSMTSEMRISMATSLILLSNQKIIDIIYLLPLWFDLMRLPDKALRSKLLKHIVSSIINTNMGKNNKKVHKNKSKIILKSKQLNTSFPILESSYLIKNSDQNQVCLKNYNVSIGYDLKKFNSTIISFLRERMEDSRDIIYSLAIIMEVYNRNIWNNAQTVNMIANCCIKQNSSKIVSIAANFLLGKNSFMEDLDDHLSDEDEKKELATEATKAMKSALLSLSSNSRKKKIEKAKSSIKRMEKNNKENNLLTRSNRCIDLVHNPQDFSEELFQRVMRHSDPFEVRLVLIGLISRLIERHKLILINYYSFLGRYLSPNNRNVTSILAYLAQACHELIPPQELSSTIKILMDNFVNECCRPEVIIIGLNTIREICQRIPTVLDKDKLMDLSNFRNMNNKGISIAAKSLINLYREIMPNLLHRSLLSKEAALNIKEGKYNILNYGDKKIDNTISGVDLLMKYNQRINKKRSSIQTELEESEDLDSELDELQEFEEDMEIEENTDNERFTEDELESIDDNNELESTNDDKNSGLLEDKYQFNEDISISSGSTNNLILNKILDQDDFKLIKKLKTRVEVAKALGVKHLDDPELSTTSSEEESEGFSSEDDSLNSDEDISKEIKSEIIRNVDRKKRNKQQRIQSILNSRESRESYTEKRKRESMNKKQSIPQTVQSRNKPMMMVIKKKSINKKNQSSNMKIKKIKAHIRNLKKDTGGKKRFRKR